MPTQRLDRSIRLLQVLDHRDGMSLTEIAKLLECSQRTVHRDLQLLKDNGYEVERTEGGYRLTRQLDLPAPTLEMSELLALSIATKGSPLTLDEAGNRLVQSTLQKILAGASETTKRRWFILSRVCQIDPKAVPFCPSDASRLAAFASAIEQRHPIQCRDHVASRPTALGPLLMPDTLCGQPDGWFVQGTDHDQGTRLAVALAQIPAAQPPASVDDDQHAHVPTSSAVPPPHALAERPKPRRP